MTSCVHLDIALVILLFTAALTGLRFIRAESPNADLLVDALNRMETGLWESRDPELGKHMQGNEHKV